MRWRTSSSSSRPRSNSAKSSLARRSTFSSIGSSSASASSVPDVPAGCQDEVMRLDLRQRRSLGETEDVLEAAVVVAPCVVGAGDLGDVVVVKLPKPARSPLSRACGRR